MKIFKIIFTAALLMLMPSCYDEINLENYRSKPTLVLNAAISSDTAIMVNISGTKHYYDIRNESEKIDNATVILYINGEFTQQLEWFPNENIENKGIYKSTYTPKYGDTVKLIASHENNTVWAEDIVISPTRIISTSASIQKSDKPSGTKYTYTPNGLITEYIYGYDVTYHITFTDDVSTQNFYCIRIASEDNSILGEPLDYTLDAVFINQQNFIDGVTENGPASSQGGLTFSDEIFNGQEYTLKIREPFPCEFGIPQTPTKRRITLYSLSESFYKYLTYILNFNDENLSNIFSDIGFAEPIKPFSNINGGTGIFGMIESSYTILDITPYFPKE